MTAADLDAVRAIFNHAVEHTTAVWTETPRSDSAQRAWYEEKQAGDWPTLVAEAAGAVVGFAAVGPFRPQPGFRETAEHSVYVAPTAQGRGVGRALLTALLDRAPAAGLRCLIGVLSADNAASLKLHAALGFEEVGRLPGVGVKWNRRLDAVFVQRALNEAA
ncbi:GNAT family N-acetyltransferase [Alienimonas sp. DA493]|uniref:GNAT family N-acetyltransferase n=1 Tax=Alienimonas sp. DA493 TaxID=3373605 RepID=UPI0037551AB4